MRKLQPLAHPGAKPILIFSPPVGFHPIFMSFSFTTIERKESLSSASVCITPKEMHTLQTKGTTALIHDCRQFVFLSMYNCLPYISLILNLLASKEGKENL